MQSPAVPQTNTNNNNRRRRRRPNNPNTNPNNPTASAPSTAARPNPLQQWIPRGAPSPPPCPTATSSPLLPTPPPPIPNNPHRHHRPRNPNPKPNPSRPIRPPTNNPDPSIPQLVQEIEEKLTTNSIECMICYDTVRRSSPIWSCSHCYSIFHLHCTRKWARSPNSSESATPSNTEFSGWRCPGCQTVQLVSAKDIAYTCFCGNRPDPPNDLYLTPHSCGEPCRKPLDKTLPNSVENSSKTGELGELSGDYKCPHVCVLQCHPGPCPPCKAFAPRRPCGCGKTTIVGRCADGMGSMSCGEVCNRVLPCGRHHCERICHVGDCGGCGVLVRANCSCKKTVEMVLCGDMAIKGDVEEIGEGVFSCNEVCGRKLSCGNHFCRENCHPGPCGDCELRPDRVKSCHCGKTKLENERKSCLDPIPTCSSVCGKTLVCGIHKCNENCHEGDCPPCLVRVNQKCRCGSSSRMVECYKVVEERDVFVCDRPCGKKKNCGRHRCSERCCPLLKPFSQLSDGEWDPHFCSMPCEKKLRCGQHSCQLLCHSGHCPPCLETIFTDLTCACGKTSIPPPLPCGTPNPSCTHPCIVPQPCGHLASHTCHFGDCPPCSVPVAKECIGGHVMLRNIPCGSRDIRCNQLCGKTRQCGIHACARTCHSLPCDTLPAPESSSSGSRASCGQVCGAPRRDCRHTCAAPCHPMASCPDVMCEFPVTITCSCGRITSTVPCSAGGNQSGLYSDPLFEASIIQKLPVPLQPVDANDKKVPLGQRKLTCNDECAKLERKRVLADAFDITTPNLDALHFGENSSGSELLADLFRREQKWVLAIEERFKFMVLGKSKAGSGLKVHVFCPMLKEKIDAVRQMAERWKLTVHAAGWEPKRFLVVHVTPKSRPPARILGSKPGVPVVAPHPPVFDPLVDIDPRLVVAMLDLPRDADISALVLRFGGECELVWLNDKNAVAVFGDPVRAATALRRLDHGSVYQGVTVVLPNGGLSSSSATNAWGVGSKEVGVAPKSGNPWKKVLAPESSSAWGGDWSSGADAAVPAWRGNEPAPISASVNPWEVLNPDSTAYPFEAHNVASGAYDGSVVKAETAGVSSEGQDDVAGRKVEMVEEVENWEEAYE